MIWRLFGAYSILLTISFGLLGWLLIGRMENHLLQEVRHDLEELPKLFGGDWYACSLEANQGMLDTMARYAAEQGFTREPINPAEYFVA